MESVKTTITADHSRNFTVLEEIDNLKPTEEEIRLYAKGLGIDPDKEEYLLPIAQEGVSAPLPGGWQALRSRDGSIVYQQTQSGIVVYEHPLDSLYRAKVAEARKKKMNSLTDQTESKTVYQHLPEPKPCKGNPGFKIPSLPPAHNDSNSGSGSILTLSNSNMPHVQSSPTANKTPVAKKVLGERNTNSKPPPNSLRRSHRDGNPSPNIDKLSDRFRNEVRVSIPSETENNPHNHHSHTTSSVKRRQRPKEDSRSTRRLFDDDEDGCASSLFSPQGGQNNSSQNNQQYTFSPLTPGFHQRGPLPDIPPIGELFAAEFDSNVSLRYLLEEQTRIHDKIAVLKATYKAYKARLAGINSSISMLHSTRTAAMLAAGNFSNSRISSLSTNQFHSPSYHFRHRSHSTMSRRPATGAISPVAATASESHQKPFHHQQVQQKRRGDDRDRRFSVQNLTSSKKTPRSAL
ncbi:unnamed protein product [Hymenolepis diminuta]|uniref:WW domain-containing protein n=1 Tax=Hymenolepis diminuta TaxID=6216 RepID=A0A0R3STT7_HYMDI|nr:unnamed protein product [Hymenolepis diminuta]VUZ55569.1 unnamed protein product [Hymenolepis diminuta]